MTNSHRTLPTTSPRLGATILGYPRIGPDRELKRTLEAYWGGKTDQTALHQTARDLRERTWRRLRDLGLDSVPSNTFSYYDQVLDAAVLVDAVPDRFRGLATEDEGDDDLRTYFAMARGEDGVLPLEMTKWFDTNYHYLVPEIGPATRFRLAGDKPLTEYREAAALGIETRPVLLGPVSLLLLSKLADDAPDGFRPLDRLDDLVDVYRDLLAQLADLGVAWVQLDEPAFVMDRTEPELAALRRAYDLLGSATERPSIMAASYFGDLGPALPILAASAVEAIAVDLVAGSGVQTIAGLTALRDKTVVAGVVDGRNVWRTDRRQALSTLAVLLGLAGDVAVSTSCSLLHVPYDLDAETGLDADVRARLAFADQKVGEVVALGKALREEGDGAPNDGVANDSARIERGQLAARSGETVAASTPTSSAAPGAVRVRVEALHDDDFRRVPYGERATAQREALALPELPTTTIGSFPQTAGVRAARTRLRQGSLSREDYTATMQTEIIRVVRLQEKLGLDVLVHGEPERNDMVQYFAEQLAGFVTTENGWVQSYGSRCVRPPILHGDVSRPEPMTVEWATYAQSLTDRPMKGMLTGPVTMLAWSFVRDDQPLGDTALQVALAIRDEVADLEAAGIRIIQVDEPALRELLPLRANDRPDYLDWSVAAFRLATSGVLPATQIHTHLCYSEFGDVIDAIDGLEADVTSIEAARSKMEILADVATTGQSSDDWSRGIGPGVYDIHSPRVPDADELEELVRKALVSVPSERLWVNPDCGLKTRAYDQVEPALAAMVEAARRVRG